ncbi:hypothetical protein [Streptomyces sp. NPDC085529]|uniref:hypothetical protein n=1 Tax=Streptomyces sp. NPDC085529 TaxID=3365729 RepID=UPI0037CE83AD
MTSRPAAVTDAAGRVQIFYRGGDGAAWRAGQSDDHQSFQSAVSLGGSLIGRRTAG